MLMDMHSHLDLYPEPHKVVAEVVKREIYLLSVTTTPSAWPLTKSLAGNSSFIRTGLGLHPQLASERHHELDLFDKYLQETRYVGEIGLDGSDEYRVTFEIQKKVFEHILRRCVSSGGKILSIHSRGAAREVVQTLRKHDGCGIPIFHWFSGSADELHEAIKLGGWFSVGLPMLLSRKGRSLISQMPRNRVLTETDGPFSTIKGRSQLPWDVEEAVSLLCEVWNLSRNEVDDILKQNLRSLVSKRKI